MNITKADRVISKYQKEISIGMHFRQVSLAKIWNFKSALNIFINQVRYGKLYQANFRLLNRYKNKRRIFSYSVEDGSQESRLSDVIYKDYLYHLVFSIIQDFVFKYLMVILSIKV